MSILRKWATLIKGDELEKCQIQLEKGDNMLDFILRLLFPSYYEYEEQMKKQIEKEREMLNNER